MAVLMFFYLHAMYKRHESWVITRESMMHEKADRTIHINQLIKPNTETDE